MNRVFNKNPNVLVPFCVIHSAQTVRHQWRNMHTFQPLLLRCTLPPSLRCTLPPSRSTSKAHVAAITHLKGWLWVLHEDLLYSFGGGSLCELGSQVLTAVVALECHILPWTAQGRAHYHELYQMTVYSQLCLLYIPSWSGCLMPIFFSSRILGLLTVPIHLPQIGFLLLNQPQKTPRTNVRKPHGIPRVQWVRNQPQKLSLITLYSLRQVTNLWFSVSSKL